jgi:hypothetical protein
VVRARPTSHGGRSPFPAAHGWQGEAERDLHLYGSEDCTYPAYFRIAETRQQPQATIEDRGNVIAAIAAPMLGLLYFGPMP